MPAQSIVVWVDSVTSKLLPSQSAPVAAAVRCERVNLAAVCRSMVGDVPAKHTIKRAWRFASNRRVEVAYAMAGVIRGLMARRGMAHVPSEIDYRRGRQERHNVVRWREGLPKGRGEPWNLRPSSTAAPSGCATCTLGG